MPEEENAAVELEDRLKDFDVLSGGNDTNFADVIREIENPKPEPEPKDPKPDSEAEEKVTKDEPAPEKDEKPKKKDEPEAEGAEEDKPEAKDDNFFEEFGEGEEKTAAEVDDDDAPPKNLSKAGKEDWEKLRGAKAELKTQLQEANNKIRSTESEVAELKKQLAELPELRKKAEFVEEAEKELALSRVEATREYKEKVGAPLKEIESMARQIAKSNELDEGKLFDALSEPDAGSRRQLLKEVTADMDSVDTNDVFQMARDTQRLLDEQQRIRTEAKEAAKETLAIQEKKTTEAAQKAKEEYDGEVDRVVSGLKDRLAISPLDTEKEEDLPAIFDAVAKNAKETGFDDASAAKKAFLVASGLLMPRLAKQLASARKEVQTLQTRVKELGDAEPRIDNNTPPPAADDTEADIVDQIMAATGGQKHQTITEILQEVGGS